MSQAASPSTGKNYGLALLAFKETYGRQWRICRRDYRSPAQIREKRKAEDARAAYFQGETVRET